MAHLLIVDLPGRIDTDIIGAALARGDTFSFLTAGLARYLQHPGACAALSNAARTIEAPSFESRETDRLVLQENDRQRIDAVLCLQHLRVRDAARLAALLGTRHLHPDSAALLMDKHAVRTRLARSGVAQPAYALAAHASQLRRIVRRLGLPVLIKPADGHGSQGVVIVQDGECFDFQLPFLERALQLRLDYGLGVQSSGHLLVERYMQGTVVGCDTFTEQGHHRLLGINDKCFFAPPSFAIRGGCFTPAGPGMRAIEDYVFAALDAVGFDWGAAHVELMLTADGPRLIEINPRLVGSTIPRLVSHATGRSMHQDLIALHLGQGLPPAVDGGASRVAVTRWVVAARAGVLERIEWPPLRDACICGVEQFVQPGEYVRPPLKNSDRLACVMARAASREEAEAAAEAFVSQARVVLKETA